MRNNEAVIDESRALKGIQRRTKARVFHSITKHPRSKISMQDPHNHIRTSRAVHPSCATVSFNACHVQKESIHSIRAQPKHESKKPAAHREMPRRPRCLLSILSSSGPARNFLFRDRHLTQFVVNAHRDLASSRSRRGRRGRSRSGDVWLLTRSSSGDGVVLEDRVLGRSGWEGFVAMMNVSRA